MQTNKYSMMLSALAELNKQLEETQSWEENQLIKLDKLPEYQAYLACKEDIKIIKEQIEAKKDAVKSLAINDYNETGDKNPYPDVSVIINNKVDYDPLVARTWCEENLPKALMLDTKLFEKHAKALKETMPIPFVDYYQSPSVRISSDLTDYLE